MLLVKNLWVSSSFATTVECHRKTEDKDMIVEIVGIACSVVALCLILHNLLQSTPKSKSPLDFHFPIDWDIVATSKRGPNQTGRQPKLASLQIKIHILKLSHCV